MSITNNENDLMTNDMLNVDNSEMEGKYLTFWTDGQLFGISIANVEQIIGMQEITGIPEFPYYAKGIINLRGNVIPVIDVRIRLNKAEAEYNERTCIIVTNIDDSFVGFIVDEVNEVVDINSEQISPPPKVTNDTVHSYLTGIAKLEDGVVLIVDSAKILSQSLLNDITI